MRNFLSFLYEDFLIEEKVLNNTKGVLHELLVGYHLNGGKHMEKHPDVRGNSPEEAHDKLKSTISTTDYNLINQRAKAAAEDIKKTVGAHGPIHNVQWTSKPGDLHRATGIHASQKEDASDIVVTTKHANGETKHHGISLKVSDKPSSKPTVSNPGMKASYGAEHIVKAHQDHIKALYPELAKLKNKPERKAYVNKHPEIKKVVRNLNKTTLDKLGNHLHEKLSSLSHEDLVHHIKHHLLHAEETPMERQGHFHYKHTTGGMTNYRFTTENHAKDYHHILSDPQNIKVEKRGQSSVFTYKGKPFIKHTLKFNSQSDPLSSVNGVGQLP